MRQCSDGYTRVPLIREVVLDGDTPVSAFAKLHRGRYGLLLESLEGGERWARYSFLATEPAAVYRYHGDVVERSAGNGDWHESRRATTAPLDIWRRCLRDDRSVEVAGTAAIHRRRRRLLGLRRRAHARGAARRHRPTIATFPTRW